VTIAVKENELKVFQGFMLQARRADNGPDDNTPVGTFQTISGTKRICRQVTIELLQLRYWPLWNKSLVLLITADKMVRVVWF